MSFVKYVNIAGCLLGQVCEILVACLVRFVSYVLLLLDQVYELVL